MADPRIWLVQSVLTNSDALRLRHEPFVYSKVRRILDLSYDPHRPGPDHTLDLYLPRETKGPCPLLIDIHGGGLVYGNKELNRWTCAEMAARGHAVAALNYPLIPEVSLIEQLQSLLQALAFIDGMAHPDLDLTRVSLKGDSGGGLLAILLSELNALEEDQKSLFQVGHTFPIRALCLIHPMIHTKRRDILAFIEHHKGVRDRVGPEEWGVLSHPTEHIKSDVPVWLVTSQNDFMFHKEARELAEKLKQAGNPGAFYDHRFRVVDPLGHIFMVTQPRRRESQRLYDRLDRFLQSIYRRSAEAGRSKSDGLKQ